MNARMMWLHALSPVHVGAGDSLDVIDLPVIREKVTNWPYLPASSIKGVLRDRCGQTDKNKLFWEAFGPDTVEADKNAGSLWFADAHLLCFPVRSLVGTFAWVTCPLALRRLARDTQAAGLPLLPHADEAPQAGEILLASQAAGLIEEGKTYLEDLDLSARIASSLNPLALAIAQAVFDDADWQEEFQARFGLISDDLFTFLTETGTDISAHIKIQEETKSVQSGALWYEESVPAEAIFTMPLVSAPRWASGNDALQGLIATAVVLPLQIGGKASVGRGVLQTRLRGGEGGQ